MELNIILNIAKPILGRSGIGVMDGWMKWKPQIVHQVKVLFSSPKKRTKDCGFHLGHDWD